MNFFNPIAIVCVLAGVNSAFGEMDDAKLEEWLSGNFIAPESMRWEEIDDFKTKSAIQDDQLHRVLMKMYREANENLKTVTPKTREWNANNRAVEGILRWLPKCGDIPVKDFLMSYATTKENDSWLREVSILSYLREADAEETKKSLLQFLVEGDRMNSQERSSICEYARVIFNGATVEKKTAILESLYVALSYEDNKWLFSVYDDILVKYSKDYANSHERLAILKRLIKAPSLCKVDDYAMPELQEKLKTLQKMRLYTNINTNLAVLKARDFNLPLPAGETNTFVQTTSEKVNNEAPVTEKGNRLISKVAVLGSFVVILLGLGIWKFLRK